MTTCRWLRTHGRHARGAACAARAGCSGAHAHGREAGIVEAHELAQELWIQGLTLAHVGAGVVVRKEEALASVLHRLRTWSVLRGGSKQREHVLEAQTHLDLPLTERRQVVNLKLLSRQEKAVELLRGQAPKLGGPRIQVANEVQKSHRRHLHWNPSAVCPPLVAGPPTRRRWPAAACVLATHLWRAVGDDGKDEGVDGLVLRAPLVFVTAGVSVLEWMACWPLCLFVHSSARWF
mmetsp:Transcript_61901/g.133113  ORF Transcript_61901/g.133113 Transcript_61901/m.133113 type:complete len:235 (+) Transcript_61901:994-1698(+)